jgi:hypothetical protein
VARSRCAHAVCSLAATAAVFAALIAASPAAAAYPPWVRAIRDCADDGRIQGKYAPADLEKALHNLPADGDEYYDCRNELEHALDGGSGKDQVSPPPPNGIVTESGAVAASADDVAALQAVTADAAAGNLQAVAADAGAVAPPGGVADLPTASSADYPLAPARDALIITAILMAIVTLVSVLRRQGP